jgi:hypothetical protein
MRTRGIFLLFHILFYLFLELIYQGESDVAKKEIYQKIANRTFWGSLDPEKLWADRALLISAGKSGHVDRDIYLRYLSRLHGTLFDTLRRDVDWADALEMRKVSRFSFEVDFGDSDSDTDYSYIKIPLREILAVRKIEKVVARCLYDPKSELCRRKLKRDFDYLVEIDLESFHKKQRIE